MKRAHRERGLSLTEAIVSLALAAILGGMLVGAVLLAMRALGEADRRLSAGESVRRGLGAIESAVRSSRRDTVLAVRASADPATPALPTGTAGAALFLSTLTGFHPSASMPLYADGVRFSVAADPRGGISLFCDTWVGSTTFAGNPTRRERLTTGVGSLTPFLFDGRRVLVTVEARRTAPDGSTVPVSEAIEVAIP